MPPYGKPISTADDVQPTLAGILVNIAHCVICLMGAQRCAMLIMVMHEIASTSLQRLDIPRRLEVDVSLVPFPGNFPKDSSKVLT